VDAASHSSNRASQLADVGHGEPGGALYRQQWKYFGVCC